MKNPKELFLILFFALSTPVFSQIRSDPEYLLL